MRFTLKKFFILFLCFFTFHDHIYAEVNQPVLLITGAVIQQTASVLPSLQNVPGNNQIVEACNTIAQLETMSEVPNILTITGDISFHENVLTISLPTDISQLQISGDVAILLPVGGTLEIFADTVLQPIPSNLHLFYTNSDHTFTMTSSVQVSGGFVLNSSENVTVKKTLSVTGLGSATSITIGSGATLTVWDDISFANGVVDNEGTIVSTFGNILMSNNVGSDDNPGVLSKGIISTSLDKSLTFSENSSSGTYGVSIFSGSLEAGTVNFVHNSGTASSGGVQINGNVYTNSLQVNINCASSYQEFILNTIVYEYVNHAIPLAPSQIHIQNVGCVTGTLTIQGDITFAGNNVAITVTSLSDITIDNIVVFDVPVGGNLIINNVPYSGTIPGLWVTHGQPNNTFNVQGALIATTAHVAGVTTLRAGLTTTSDIAITSGSLTLPNGAATFNAGGNIAVTSGAALSLGSTLTTCVMSGSITGLGAVTINSGFNVPGAASVSTFTIGASVNVSGGLTAYGTVTVNHGTLSATGSGLHVTAGDILVRAGGSLYIAAGGIGVHTSGSIIFEDDSFGFYSGQVSVDSGNFTMGSGASFLVSGGGISLGGSAIMTLNSVGTTGTDLVAQSLYIGAAQTVYGGIYVTGGSMNIASDTTVTAGGLFYNGSGNVGTSFINYGTVQTNGGVQIQNANYHGVAVTTGIVNAGGSLTISGNTSSLAASSAVLVSGNISGVDVRIDSNSANTNGNTVFCQNYTITASGLLDISGNSSLSGGSGVFLNQNIVSAGSTITISNNNAGSGSSVGVYLGCTLKTPSSITMDHNTGTVYGVRVADGAVQTNSTFTITVADDTSEIFNSSAITITQTDGSTVVPFASFVITVGSEVQSSYPVLHNRVLLATGNQS